MKHKTLPDNIVEPKLIAEWRRLNKEVFDSELKQEPITLCWHFDIRSTGGYCNYYGYEGQVKIVIKATLKENYDAWLRTLIHEMVHQLLWERYCEQTELGAEIRAKFDRDGFLADKGYFFWAEIYKLAKKLGYSFKELAHWDYEDEDATLKDKSQRAYLELKEMEKRGKANKGKLFN